MNLRLNVIMGCLLSAILSHAQTTKSVWYLKAGAGLGHKGIIPQSLTVPSIYPSPTSLTITDGTFEPMSNSIDSIGQRSLVHDTYSKGTNFFISAGLKLPSRLGFELGLLWLQGGNINARSVLHGNLLLGGGAIMDIRTYARGFALMPALTYDFPLNTKWFIQARMGFSIPVGGAIFHRVQVNAPKALFGPTAVEVESRTEARFSLGINGGIGIHRRLGHRWEVFGGVVAQHLNLIGKSVEISRYDLTINNTTTDQLAAENGLYHRRIKFVDELNPSSNNREVNANINPDAPKEVLRLSSAFSNIGLAIGVAFNFSGKKE